MAILLRGKPVADALKTEITDFSREHRITIAVIQVGNDEASTAYRKAKTRRAVELGIRFEEYLFDVFVPIEDILSLIERLNARDEINGIFVEQPLPRGFDKEAIADAIRPDKDIDGSTKGNSAALYLGKKGIFPATAEAVMAILRYYDVQPGGRTAVVVGRSNVVGKPLSMMLLHADATVTVCHSKTADLSGVVSRGDIVVAAVGKAGLIGAGHIKEGAVVIDAGYNVGAEGVSGDVDFKNAETKAEMITPVPGGVGSVTNVMVFSNLVKAYKIQHGL